MNTRKSHPSAAPRALRAPARSLSVRLLALVLGASAPAGFGANITLTQAFLDSVNGFVNFAHSTLGSGQHAITNNLQPGDTVFIQAHTRSFLTLVNLTQGTAANPITVTNTGGQFIIDYTGSPPSLTGIGLWGLQHVHFKGTPGSGYTYGIKVNRTAGGTSGVKVDYNQNAQGQVGGSFANTIDLEISNIEVANTGFAGIHAKYEINNGDVPSGVTALLDGLHIHDCYIHHTGGEGMYLGWTSDGHPPIANVTVNDNLLVNTGWDGIQLGRSQGTNEIYNNTILGHGVTSNTSDPTYYFWHASAFSLGHNSNLKVHHNYTDATNMYSGSAVTLFFTGTTQIYNNVFVLGSHSAPTPQPGMYITQVGTFLPGVSLTFANNTIVEPGNNGIEFNPNDNLNNGQPADEGGINVPVTLINNIVARPLAGSYVVNPGITTPTSTTNLYVSTLAAAGFVSSSDFHLASGSAAIDAGTTVALVTDDFDGTTRPSGSAYDIGAYEYVSSTPSETVLTPAGTGTATGSSYCPASGAFNEQPTWNSGTGAPSGVSSSPHTGTETNYANRFWYVDFGPNWAKVRITQMWTRYRPNSSGSFSGFASLWWDNDTDTTNDGTTASTMNFCTGQNVPNVSTQEWMRDRDFRSAPITPVDRYLVVSTGATVLDRPNEFAFIGYVVP